MIGSMIEIDHLLTKILRIIGKFTLQVIEDSLHQWQASA